MKTLYVHCVLVTMLCILLAGCSGSAAMPTEAADSAGEQTPELPACAEVGPAISLPAEFPPNFPLPPGTVIHASRNTEEGVLIVDAVMPVSLQAAADFFLRELPTAGFLLGFGDSEFDEAESAFSGNGYDGHFKVHSILDCPGAVTLTLALTRR